MPSINIQSIEVSVAGISADTIGGALRALPVALGQKLSQVRGRAIDADIQQTVRLERDSSEEDVARAVATRIATVISARLAQRERLR